MIDSGAPGSYEWPSICSAIYAYVHLQDPYLQKPQVPEVALGPDVQSHLPHLIELPPPIHGYKYQVRIVQTIE